MVLCTIRDDLAGRHHVEGEGMTRGRMAPALVALLIGSLMAYVPLFADLLTSEGATEESVPLLSIPMPHHRTIGSLNAPQFGSIGYHLRTAIRPGDAT